ncbi:thymidylate synthase [Lysobacter koreensis]|uniref:thymidylate synthase n=1 Tax=Lysobacter koreensis TaxID=266122 RepID=A0ABW2YRB7_9GAMM
MDDLLHRVLTKLLAKKGRGLQATRGVTLEKTGVILHLTNPRARLSRTARRSQIFSCLGELAWYLAKTDSLAFITYYVAAYKKESADNKTISGAYGPRMFNFRGEDQVANIIKLLRERQNTRRAVIQIFDAADLKNTREVPCTCSIQFMVRQKKLHAFTMMRSNDAYLGLPHDVFAFTMIQELIARAVGVEIGTYKHVVGSLHLYEDHIEAAQAYVEDGLHETVQMPPMPVGNQFEAVKHFLKVESKIRRKKKVDLDSVDLEPYWKDLARLLRIYRFSRDSDPRGMARQMKKMTSKIYDQYIENKRRGVQQRLASAPVQRPLFPDSDAELAN